ncbi:MAG: uracil-DNA glycosylase [Hyphomicrobiaceae bacterium]|nr:uracil-DNA glycosylase [Hyphomicrobiaceae bacterium]
MSNSYFEDSKKNSVLLATLKWYAAMGVDTAQDAEAIDWLGRGDNPPLSVSKFVKNIVISDHNIKTPSFFSKKSSSSHLSADSHSNNDKVVDLQVPSFDAQTLQTLQHALMQFDGCGLKLTATRLCFSRGTNNARVMVIGEAPGRDEDLSGQPFVGRAGQLLDKMLNAIDLDENTVYYTNIVYWRPPGNRTPTSQEILACRPFLERQIDLVAPDVILAAGGLAAKEILRTSDGIMKLRGKWGTYSTSNGSTVRVMPTLHPAYLLRTPASKLLAWRDLMALKEVIS